MHALSVLRLHGSQRQMGAQHGALLRRLGGWEDLVDYYPTMPQRMLLGSTRRSAADDAVIAAARPVFSVLLARLAAARPAAYAARTEAFAEALGRPELARHLSVMDVFQNAIGALSRIGMVPVARRLASTPPSCSSLAVWGDASADGRLLHARNFDFPGTGLWERGPTVVMCSPDEGLRYGFIATRGADVPGATAFNEAGLSLTAHTRFHRDVCFGGAAIVDLGHDMIRRAQTIDEAIAIARERTVASTWGLLLSSAAERRAVVIETTSAGVEVTEHAPGEDFTATTNRYHAPALQDGEVEPSAAWIWDCEGRLARLHHWARRGGLDVDDLKRMLGDATCRETGLERPTGGVLATPYTVASVVFDPERGVVHVGVGGVPTATGPWLEVPYSWEGEPVEIVQPTGAVTRDGRLDSGAPGEAYARYREAVRLEQRAAPPAQIADSLRRAADLDPDEPIYAFLAGASDLAAGDDIAALARLEHAAATEVSVFQRGRNLLWASRAAARLGQTRRADDLRDTLLALDHPLIGDYRGAALAERKRPYRWTKGVPVHATLCDAG